MALWITFHVVLQLVLQHVTTQAQCLLFSSNQCFRGMSDLQSVIYDDESGAPNLSSGYINLQKPGVNHNLWFLEVPRGNFCRGCCAQSLHFCFKLVYNNQMWVLQPILSLKSASSVNGQMSCTTLSPQHILIPSLHLLYQSSLIIYIQP